MTTGGDRCFPDHIDIVTSGDRSVDCVDRSLGVTFYMYVLFE